MVTNIMKLTAEPILTVDDRHRPVALRSIEDRWLRLDRDDPRLRSLRKRLNWRPGSAFLLSGLLVLGLPPILLPWARPWIGVPGGITGLLFGAAVMAATIVLFGLMLRRLQRRRLPPIVIRAFLFNRLCPGCAYDLKNLPMGGDGLVECPECGAAWRIPPAAG